MQELKKEDLSLVIKGATIMGTGGGGNPRAGLSLLKNVDKVTILSVDEISDDAILISPYFLGSIAPSKEHIEVKIPNPLQRALEEIKALIGRVDGIIPCELGGYNTAVALYAGWLLKLPVIDGDLVGRAAPEIHQSTIHIFKLPVTPAVLVSLTGNVIIIKDYASIDDYEKIARYISTLAKSSIAVIDTPITGNIARKVIIRNTISLCLRLGRIISSSNDPINNIIKELEGWLIFKGIVKEFKWEDKQGFLEGEVILEGTDEWRGHKFKTWIKNEHIIAWRDNEVIVMPPDLIIFLKEKGEPITNSELEIGVKVYVICAKAPSIWRTKEGLELFGPRHFGFNYEYVPVEILVQS